MSGKLYIVGSPIGNLGDMTLRGIETLKNVEVVYAEDTRVTHKLLSRYKIVKPLRSFREAASPTQVKRTVQEIIDRLARNEDVAFLSDAGTPGVSDPGQYLVQLVVEAGYEVVPIPGVSALTTILSVAGYSIPRPLFVGFLPKKKGHQTLVRNLKEALVSELCDGIVLYESPERIVALLRELADWNIPLNICLGRELTKQFEELLRGSLENVLANLAARPSIKGEITLVVCLRN